MINQYICSKCSKSHAIKPEIFRCDCGGLLNLKTSIKPFSPGSIRQNDWSQFRYVDNLPVDQTSGHYRSVTMGEGMTPVVQIDQDVWVKVDYMMPTLSFKDRGAAVLISIAREIGAKKIIQDSSGNAGNSIAAYASRVNIPCEIFVPKGTSDKKIKMIRSHGAKVHIVNGSREDTATAALNTAVNEDVFYASHVYNPFFYQGTKTYAFEIFEQFAGRIPDNIIVPVGNGTLLLGVFYGFTELLQSNLIQHMPRIIAVQSAGCDPIYQAYCNNLDSVLPTRNMGTAAEGIAIANPLRGRQILEAVRETKGMVVTAPEEKIVHSQNLLAQKGFYVEPTTAATYAGFLHHKTKLTGTSIIPLCGSGLKKG